MRDLLLQAFADQAQSCAALGSPFMAWLMQVLPGNLVHAPRLAALYEAWPGDPSSRGESLPLRLAGGLHALVRAGRVPELAASYPPASPDGLSAELASVLSQWDAWLCDWVQLPPQTNEVGRSAILLAAAATLTDRLGLPLHLSELGASAGLNLNFDRYALRLPDRVLGQTGSDVVLTPEWRGALPPAVPVQVVSRGGADLNPPDVATGADRLMAYVWPDQTERMSRLTAAIRIAAGHPVKVERADAADWLESRLQQPWDGACHMVFHTIAYQYFPQTVQNRIRAALEAAGTTATVEAPLAWVGMEADGLGAGAGLTLRLWPGDLRLTLGRAGFHGQWVEWTGGYALAEG